jgi:ubiquinone/menaquinone biosynthesis C-methylase UbiE
VLRSHRWRTAANSAAYLLDALHPGLDVLDVGCGPGTITVDLAHLVAPGRVVAVDAAAVATTATATAARDAGVDVAVVQADAYRLPLPDAAVDVVHAHQVLQHLADPVAALVEWRRVTRPGGLVAARDADYAAMHWWPADERLERWRHLYRRLARANGGEPDAGRRLHGWVRAAGFSSIRSGASTWVFCEPDDRHWWATTWAERITASELARQIVADGLARRDELDDLAAAWQSWARHPDGWFCVVHAEVLATV